MVIGGTLFQHTNIHKGTVDHVMIDQWHRSNLLDVRSYRGATDDSDHYLVIARLRCCRAQMNNQKIPKAPLKYNKERLGINEVKQEYTNKLVNWIKEINGRRYLNWSVLQQSVVWSYR